MTLVHRVLYPHAIESFDEYLQRRGGVGIENARALEPAAIVEMITESGLRGRGGAGFPTGRKWQTIVENRSPRMPSTIVVNGAEGEPGTYKDRTILQNNPYQVIEGALIAAKAVGADQIFFGTKKSFEAEVVRLRAALDEVVAAGWAEGIEFIIFEGPNEYLYGEETALLETIDGRYPFPRIAPPFRRGVRELVESEADAESGSGLSAHVHMAGPGTETVASPTLVDNVETMANVPHILARGASWFRTEGTDESPGTIVCTVTGSTVHAGVGEVQMGTPLRQVIDEIGGGARPGRQIKAVLSGVSNAFITADQLDAPVSYEGLAAIGSGLGSAGFMVFDDADDLVAVTAGVSRFLSIESCGQCSPCKQDGLFIADVLAKLCASAATEAEMTKFDKRLTTVADGARCYLATQHQTVVNSLLERFADEVDAHRHAGGPVAEPVLVAELVTIDAHGARIDEHHADKQPDWSYDAEYHGQVPAERFGEHRRPEDLD